MKILCYINHFFGKGTTFLGKSSLPGKFSQDEINQRANRRKEYILTTLKEFKSYGSIDIKICGIEGYSLLPLDLNLSKAKENPVNLVFESLTEMSKHIDNYDYFINIEDDILLPKESFSRIVEFDRSSLANEILLPNRLETNPDGSFYCVDWNAIPGWTWQFKKFQGNEIRVAVNPHSGILILSKIKFQYAMEHIDINFREHILASGMESAFAYFHSPFSLYRTTDMEKVKAYHLDKWLYSPGEKGFLVKKTLFYKVKQVIKKILPQKLLGKINIFPMKY